MSLLMAANWIFKCKQKQGIILKFGLKGAKVAVAAPRLGIMNSVLHRVNQAAGATPKH